MLLPVAVTTFAALALIPVPRVVAWLALLALPALLAYLVARPTGVTAAVAAGCLYLWAHGRPRFALMVTDQWTIRLAFLLGALGALGACAGEWYRRTHQQR